MRSSMKPCSFISLATDGATLRCREPPPCRFEVRRVAEDRIDREPCRLRDRVDRGGIVRRERDSEDLALVTYDRDVELLRERDRYERLQLSRRETRWVGEIRRGRERRACRSHRAARTIRERVLPDADAAAGLLRAIHRAVRGLDERVRIAGRARAFFQRRRRASKRLTPDAMREPVVEELKLTDSNQ